MKVTILILIDGFLQLKMLYNEIRTKNVTILILIDGFLQFSRVVFKTDSYNCHNPYFNRWFSAISKTSNIAYEINFVTILILIDGFLQ